MCGAAEHALRWGQGDSGMPRHLAKWRLARSLVRNPNSACFGDVVALIFH